MVMMRVLASLLVLGALAACAHAPAPTSALTVRRLAVLEHDLRAFTGTRLTSLDDVERELGALEELRLAYLDTLAVEVAPRERVLCLLRIAELHLDLGARVRRVPYPAGASEAERRSLDDLLSQQALPLEAVGRGVLAQAVDEAAAHGVDDRFARRARLYQRIHAGESLDRADLAVLRSELAARTFTAPRTLLEAGRIGQRAARR
ncbi:MAG: hypothetical protein A2138_04325 [Deltaproteobacteria bacterium RBG_16_71_12]|nr:MAG: hypothetical protein A2138_04325 [Deltaproteobacteria bacterium RBG_16_71_12]